MAHTQPLRDHTKPTRQVRRREILLNVRDQVNHSTFDPNCGQRGGVNPNGFRSITASVHYLDPYTRHFRRAVAKNEANKIWLKEALA